ncbi:MAG TPA: amidohydrolase family protein, partial [Thermomicrobiales bacterium]|nr:amidohydrolase family protein [Thermomicrobiales bacterium]
MTDVLIVNGRVVDGTGNPWFHADVAITGDRIERIAPPGTIDRAGAGTVIDASGQVVAPGFIDIQSHSIIPFLSDARSLSKITQGVTSEILGEAWTPAPVGGENTSAFGTILRARGAAFAREWEERGDRWARFDDWLADQAARGASVNFGSFIGGSTVRRYAMADRVGDPSPAELEAMRRVTRDAMEDGAFGVATALIYPPNAFSGTDELVAVMEVVAEYNGVHITHMRSEGDRILEGLAETIEIAGRTGVATEIYHLKAAGRDNWPAMDTVIAQIDAARASGLDITADMYPYDGAGTGLEACLPPWADEGGNIQEHIRNPEMRAKILAEMMNPSGDWESLGAANGPEAVLLAQFTRPGNKHFEGRTLADVAHELGLPWQEAAIELLVRDGHNIFCMYMMMSEDNLRKQFAQPWIRFGTDAGGIDPAVDGKRGLVHPRAYGTYPRIMGRYVRERGWLTLEDAVRKASSAVADRLGLRDRGLLR